MPLRISALAVLLFASTFAAAEDTKLEGLAGPVEVRYDAYGIPHIFANHWLDSMRALGYLHASDRLWQMDLFRRRGSGTLCEIFGKSQLNDDILMRQLGLRRTCEQFWEQGNFPVELRQDLEAYCAGVNARIAEYGADLPVYFKQLGYTPAPWTPVDCIVFGKYMAWDQSGSDDDLWFGIVAEKFGVQAFEELWPLDRPYEIPAVKTQVARTQLARAALHPLPGMASAYEAALEKFDGMWGNRAGAFGSNNWAVAGSKTRSGKPILCSDPHLGFMLPSIWYACTISAEGRSLAGVTFAGSPSIVIGHNGHIGWGITNMQADAVDYFVESVKDDDRMQYLHRGEWKTMERITEEIPVKGENPHVLNIDYTVHGPIISSEGGRYIALQWTDLGVSTDALAIFGMNRATNLQEFLAAADTLVAPAINLCYADVDGHIALHPCGALPLRTHGAGRIPMDGASGEHDWTGMIPRSQMPLAVDPAEGFVMSANGRPASIGYPFYLGYQWDPSCRARRINDMLAAANDLTIESMAPIQNDAHDKFAETFLPVFLSTMTRADLTDPVAFRVLAALSQWDYVADADSIGTIVWMRWIEFYRNAVWDDEFTAREMPAKGGSWGFSGDNKRQPMLEVLEFITREQPASRWFDVQGTPERETRDQLIASSFDQAVASLRKDFGDDITRWAWHNFNVLRINSPTGVPELARDGGPVPGDAFTVNPGGEGGRVGGGASWRMIVDFGDLSSSVGVYPGGQSEDPASPHYADLMPLWASGQYTPLHMAAEPSAIPAEAVAESRTFVP